MDCPDDKLLIAFLENGDSTILIDHLSDCESCRDRLESIAGEPIVRFDETLTYDSHVRVPNRLVGIPLYLEPDEPKESGLIGDYRIGRKIGQGGMGIVLECEDLKLNRRVAIKTIRAEFVTPQILNRLEREARNQASLNHPGIVSLYEFGSNAGWPFLVMELVKGRTLRDMIRNFPLAPKQAVCLIAQVARALDFAHSHGVLHRDVKPSNILVTEKPDPKDDNKTVTSDCGSPLLIPKLSDFGLSILIDSEHDLTRMDSILGTPAYMSPEQTLNAHAKLTPASDVYSLGVVFYESLTGRPPFQSDNIHHTLMLIQQELPVSPRALLPGLSPDLETICLKCLEKDPNLRYHSALALAEDLERYLNQQPILARPAGRLFKTWRWCCRNPALAASMAVSSLLMISLVLGSLQFGFVESNLRKIAEQNLVLARNQSIRANASEEKAIQRADDARKLFADGMSSLTLCMNRIGAWQQGQDDRTRPLADELQKILMERLFELNDSFEKKMGPDEPASGLLMSTLYLLSRSYIELGDLEKADINCQRMFKVALDLRSRSQMTSNALESLITTAAILGDRHFEKKETLQALSFWEPAWQNWLVEPSPELDFPDLKSLREYIRQNLQKAYAATNQPEKANRLMKLPAQVETKK